MLDHLIWTNIIELFYARNIEQQYSPPDIRWVPGFNRLLSASSLLSPMADAKFVVALVFAGCFGALILYLGLYYLYCCIHQECLQLDHWFHILTPRYASWYDCDHQNYIEHRSRSRSRRRKGSCGRVERRAYRSGHGVENLEWHLPTSLRRPTAVVTVPIIDPKYTQQYHSAVDWQHYTQSMGMYDWQRPNVLTQTPYGTARGSQMENVLIPLHPQGAVTPDAHCNVRQTQRPNAEGPLKASKADRSEQFHKKVKSLPKRSRFVNKVDYIHICNEYPPIVLETLKNKAQPKPASSSKSSSDYASDATEEIPRTSAPGPSSSFLEIIPSHCSSYPRFPTSS